MRFLSLGFLKQKLVYNVIMYEDRWIATHSASIVHTHGYLSKYLGIAFGRPRPVLLLCEMARWLREERFLCTLFQRHCLIVRK